MIFHQVRGRRIRGLLVDPGASSGLIGSETLRDLLASGMVPPNKVKDITWNEASTTVTGISGQADATLTRISIPFQIGSEDAVARAPTAQHYFQMEAYGNSEQQ